MKVIEKSKYKYDCYIFQQKNAYFNQFCCNILYNQQTIVMNYGSNNSNDVNNDESKAFGRGLFNQDPHVVQQRRKKQNQYKEELLKQIQESKRKKQQEKKKQRQYDAKMEQKFYQQLKLQEDRRQKYQKTYKRPEEIKPQQENITVKLKQQKKYSNSANTIVPVIQFQDIGAVSHFKTYTNKQQEQYSSSGLKGYFYEQEDRMLANMRLEKQKRYKESLDLKVQEIYQQIQDTKRALKLDKELERIRRQLKQTSSDQNYSSLQDSAYQFKDQQSQFYSLPKARPKHNQKNLADFSRIKHINNSRLNKNGYETKQYDDKWGQSGKRGNFLGNRQALDFQIEKIMGNIDTILQK